MFADYVKEKREALRVGNRHYTLRQVAARTGIEPSYLSKIERGEFAFIVGASAGDLDGLVVTGTALTLNATAVGTGALIGTFNAAANTVTITTSGGTQNTTGKVRVSVLVRKLTAPTS